MKGDGLPANAFAEPVMTMAATSSSPSSSSNAFERSRMRAEFKAFSAFGRFSVMSATFFLSPFFSTNTFSKAAATCLSE